MSLYGLFAGKGESGFGFSSTAEDVSAGLDLSGKHYLVTGANSGLGLETMRVLAMRGATVLGAARSQQKAEQACAGVKGSTVPVTCELGEPDSVRACVEHVTGLGMELDGIIANAGIMALPKLELQHGYEKQWFVNHMGHFILVTGLLPRLAPTGRVVMLSSAAHGQAPKGGVQFDNLDGSKGYSSWGNYGQSKISNLLMARELSRRLQGTDQIACAVHPGVINTNLGRHMNPLLFKTFAFIGGLTGFKTIPQGAATQTWAAVTADPAAIDGQYLYDCNVQSSSKDGQDMEVARKLWEVSEEIAAKV